MVIRWSLLFSWLFVLVAITGCTVSDEERDKKEEKQRNKEEALREHTKPIFTYHEQEDEDFKVHSFEPDFIGERVLFTGNHVESGESHSSTYVTMDNEFGRSVMDLLQDEIGESFCRKHAAISPNGNFLVFHCDGEESSIFVYHLLEKQIIYQEDLYNQKDKSDERVVAITNTGDLILENRSEQKLRMQNIYSNQEETFQLDEFFQKQDFSLYQVAVTGDGSQVLMNTKQQIYLLDTETNEVSLLQDQKDLNQNEEVTFSNIHISNNGRYVYFESASKQNRNLEHLVTFIDIQANTHRSYEGFAPYLLKNIADDGRVLVVDLLESKARVFVFDIHEEELYHIQVDSKYLSENSHTFELSPSGENLLYNSVVSTENERKHHILQMHLHDEFLETEKGFNYQEVTSS